MSYWLGTVRNGDAVPEKIMALQEQEWDQEPDLKAYDEPDIFVVRQAVDCVHCIS